MSNTTLYQGDCLEEMAKLPDNSIDAIVTDPPYGIAFMGSKWDNFGGKTCGNDSAEVRRQKAQEYTAKNSGAPRYANGHGVAPTLDAMRSFQTAMTPIFVEALRVAKPGAHLLAFGGTRTYHRLACAIEDAGWECRDTIAWVYASGFPKSMDVSKAIDKKLGAKRAERGGVGEHEGTVDFGMKNRCPKCGKPYFSANPCMCPREDKAAITEEAKKWNGWGTCLKPAFEPIIVARKPLEGTVAANVLKYGTGAINIDACRVPTENESVSNHSRSAEAAVSKGKYGDSTAQETHQTAGQQLGRFPANLIHDGSDEVLALFPDSKGMCGTIKGTEPSGITNGIYGKWSPRQACAVRGDTGSAARFFYCAKASRSERGEGNDHPTVKPIALMEYLVKLVAPRGAIVLDPFMGSGTTGVAAVKCGCGFVGMEKEQSYFEIAQRRIEAAKERGVQLELF